MPTFLIEREIPGASKLTDDELRGITQKSNQVVDGLNRAYMWRHRDVAGDKIYCIHEAESADDVLEHARCGGFRITYYNQRRPHSALGDRPPISRARNLSGHVS